MDKKLLDALNNIGDALDMLVDALKSKQEAKSSTGAAIQGGDFGKQLESINTSIKSIKSDTQEILKNQQTLIAISKNKSQENKTDEIAGASDPKKESAIKKGVGSILLIALAVLAIGLAFKIVGAVDFLSVISLALAITIISVAFEKVAKLNLSLGAAFRTSLVLVMIAGAIAVSSWIMKMIVPIGMAQLGTAIFIAATFAALSFSLKNIFIATALFDKLNISKVALLTTMVSVALAITASSWAFAFIKPMSFAQGVTAILISVTFAIISMNLGKIAQGVAIFDKMNIKPQELLKVLVGIAAAITASSWILNFVAPMSFAQGLTAIMISVVFMAISFNMEKIIDGVLAFKRLNVKPMDLLIVLLGIATAITASSMVLSFIQPLSFTKIMTMLSITIVFAVMSYFFDKIAAGIVLIDKMIGIGKLFLIPLVFMAISVAITASSHILSKAVPIDFMFMLSILAFSAVLAISVTLIGLASVLLMKMGNVGTYFEASISIVLLAGAIAASSQLIALGNYSVFPGWEWSIFAGLSILTFGLVSFVLNKIGDAKSFFNGSLAMVVIALAIAGISHILSLGNYEDGAYPNLDWALGVGASLGAFGVAAALLGTFVFGPQALVFAAGLAAILGVAGTVVLTSHILSKGNYEGGAYPSLRWSLGVGASLGAFSLAMAFLGGIIIASFGIGGAMLLAGSAAVLVVAKTIVSVSKELNKGDFTGGPTKDWASGVAIALGAFSPVYGMLIRNKIIGGVGPTEFSTAIETISKGIVTAAGEFAKSPTVWKNGPPEEWAWGVSAAIEGFAPVYDILLKAAILDKIGIGGVGVEGFVSAIKAISSGIIEAGEIFADPKNKGIWKSAPPEEWGWGVSSAIQAFAPVYEYMNNNSGFFSGTAAGAVDDMKRGILNISQTIIDVGNLFSDSNLNWGTISSPSEGWGAGIGSIISVYADIIQNLDDKNISIRKLKNYANEINGVIFSITNVAKKMGEASSAFNISINPNFVSSLASNIISYLKLSKKIEEMMYGGGIIGGVSKFASGVVGVLGGKSDSDPVSKVATGMIKLAKSYSILANSLQKFGSAINQIDEQKVKLFRSLTGNLAIISTLDQEMFNNMLDTLEERSGVFVNLLKDFKDSESGISNSVVNTNTNTQQSNPIDITNQKLDSVISILSNIYKAVDPLDDYLNDIRTSSPDRRRPS
jgi:hypothetical protein